jgi:transposase-like protein
VISSGRPMAEIARDPGINEGTLGSWVSRAKASGKIKNNPLDIDERARLKELKDENSASGWREISLKSCGVVCEGKSVKFTSPRRPRSPANDL